MDIGPGDWLRCINAQFDAQPGNVYMVALVEPNEANQRCLNCGETSPGIILHGSDPDYAYCLANFRPYHGPEVEQAEWREHGHKQDHPTRIKWFKVP